MSEQPLNLKRSLQILRQHWIAVGLIAMLGLFAGVGITALSPPMYSDSAVVALSTSTSNMTTQTVIAGSDPVLAEAAQSLDPATSAQALSGRVQVTNPIAFVLSITAEGKTAVQAQAIANAVADSYVAYVGAADTPGGRQVTAQVLQHAIDASKSSLLIPMLIAAIIGALAGSTVGVVGVLAVNRDDKRLRQRDQIADAISVPVLASVPALHLTNPHQWTRLLDEYEPAAADARRLRNALDHLGLADASSGSFTLTVLSLSSDRRALSLGPQLAAFAASQGIFTVLVVSGREDDSTTAALREACVSTSSPGRSRHLRVVAADHGSADWPDAELIVVVAVVDSLAPDIGDTIHTDTMVLGVSAGAATAEQLARVAASTADGRYLAGILVADPDRADPTTGRLPRLGRRTQMPTRITGTVMATRR
jgi:capsular polysaccharide biosynthesis protein